MDKLRWPFLLAAIIVSIVIVTIELGSAASFVRDLLNIDEEPPGIAIPTMALIDIQLVFATVLYGLGVIVPHPTVGRLQGIASLILSILLILAAIVVIFATITLILLMLALIGSFFGIVVYLAVWGDFGRSQAAAILGVLMVLKIGVGVLLILAHQRFLTNKGLVLLVVTSLVANVIVGFLHALVPIVLVSVLDAVAAIIVAILALIWAIGLLVGSVIAIVRILKPEKRQTSLVAAPA
ncbi:MAG TPA: hypothetical protein VEX62_02230 [Candidatus Limnocylindrales bacterium]|nr:hypothetical protein [Candidatus Limnocylindrales bacterium]